MSGTIRELGVAWKKNDRISQMRLRSPKDQYWSRHLRISGLDQKKKQFQLHFTDPDFTDTTNQNCLINWKKKNVTALMSATHIKISKKLITIFSFLLRLWTLAIYMKSTLDDQRRWFLIIFLFISFDSKILQFSISRRKIPWERYYVPKCVFRISKNIHLSLVVAW